MAKFTEIVKIKISKNKQTYFLNDIVDNLMQQKAVKDDSHNDERYS